MAVNLTINGQSIEARGGLSLFEHAELLGIDVPTSCRKQGKCRECMVEVVEGMDLLSAMTEPERHLKGKFRLSCQTCVTGASGQVRCHTMRRGQMRIERQAFGLPVSHAAIQAGSGGDAGWGSHPYRWSGGGAICGADSRAGDGPGDDDDGAAAAGSRERGADRGYFV